MTDLAVTSREAYESVKASGRVNEVQDKILAFMKKWRGPLTRQDLEHYLDEPINVICGRVKELLDDGRLQVTGRIKKDHNGRPCKSRELLMLPSAQYELFVKPQRQEAIQEALTS